MPRRKSKLPLTSIVDRLRSTLGAPAPPAITDPFQQILLVQVAYLATDERRLEAFQLLKDRVGLEPDAILAASDRTLLEVASAGGAAAAAKRAEHLRRSAEMVRERWDGDLTAVLSLPHEDAARALSKFPMIGKPGADAILLIAGASNKLALDSNGLRVLLRIGYGCEDKNYAKSYRSVIEEVGTQPPMPQEATVAAHVLLREHGRRVCRHKTPACGECGLSDACQYGRSRL